jgi:hypothetical protein
MSQRSAERTLNPSDQRDIRSTPMSKTSGSLSREAMDEIIEEHFRCEVAGDVEGTLA